MPHSTPSLCGPSQETLNFLRLFARVYDPQGITGDGLLTFSYPPKASC